MKKQKHGGNKCTRSYQEFIHQSNVVEQVPQNAYKRRSSNPKPHQKQNIIVSKVLSWCTIWSINKQSRQTTRNLDYVLIIRTYKNLNKLFDLVQDLQNEIFIHPLKRSDSCSENSSQLHLYNNIQHFKNMQIAIFTQITNIFYLNQNRNVTLHS